MANPPRNEGATRRRSLDPAHGLRIGTMVGGVLATAALAISGSSQLWVVLVGGAVGGAIGFWSEKRKLRHR